jgi:hypothetical protein
MALIAAAFLDDALRSLLQSYFVDDAQISERLFGTDRPLSTFSAKITLSYAVGLISAEDQRELHFIRRIRNEFAPTRRQLSFQTVPIVDLCDGLNRSDELLRKYDPDLEPRNRFWATTTKLAATLTSFGKYVQRQRYAFDLPLVFYEALDEVFHEKAIKAASSEIVPKHEA